MKKAEKGKRRVYTCMKCGKEKQAEAKPIICTICEGKNTYV